MTRALTSACRGLLAVLTLAVGGCRPQPVTEKGRVTMEQGPNVCACCGAELGDLCDVGVELPSSIAELSEDERSRRATITDEVATLDDEHFFIRANIEIPVHGREHPWVITVWGTLARQNFEKVLDRWDDPARTELGPYFSWVCDTLPGFETTHALPAEMTIRGVGLKPTLRLEESDHPLSRAQHDGLAEHEATELCRGILAPR